MTDLINSYKMESEPSDNTVRYSREELLKYQHCEQKSADFDWRHIDSLLNPTSNSIGYKIPTIMSCRLSTNEKARVQSSCNQLSIQPYRSTTRCKQKDENVNSNLIKIKTNSSTVPAQHHNPGLILSNCQSLTMDKLDELKLITEEKQPKLIMLTESWLKDDKEMAMSLDDYDLYTANRQDRVGGGVAIYSHSSIQAKVVKRYTSKTLSSLWVKVTTPKHSTIYACIYHPPSKRKFDSEASQSHISDTLAQLAKKHSHRLVVCGDFNRLA